VCSSFKSQPSRANADARGFTGATAAVWQIPLGHWPVVTCASTSARKCFSTDWIGAGTICPRPADGRQSHGLAKLVEQGEVLPILAFGETTSRPVNEHLGHLLRTDPAGYALAAGFVAVKTNSG